MAITTIKIYRALRTLLESYFPDKTVQIKDKKNIVRPSFYLKFINEERTKTAPLIEEITNTFELVYFAEENELLELLQTKNSLNELADENLAIATNGQKTKYVGIASIESSLNEDEYYLQSTISITFAQTLTDNASADKPLMQKLSMDNEITT